jgi:hypothetical protein
MEKTITYNGKKIKLEDLELSQEIWDELYEGFYTVTNLKEFAKKMGFSQRTITTLFEDYLKKVQSMKAPLTIEPLPIKTIIGNKEGPYFESEEEISKNLDCNYTWEDLTLHEKEFYLNYDGKGRKRCFVRKRNEASDSKSDGIQ